LIVVDFTGLSIKAAQIKADLTTTAGEVSPILIHDQGAPDTVRVTFTYTPGTAQSADLRLVLRQDTTAISETWIYRWTS
jgi:glucan biosynthesis protein